MESPEKVSKVGTNKKKLEYISVMDSLLAKRWKKNAGKTVILGAFFATNKLAKTNFGESQKGITYYGLLLKPSLNILKLLCLLGPLNFVCF